MAGLYSWTNLNAILDAAGMSFTERSAAWIRWRSEAGNNADAFMRELTEAANEWRREGGPRAPEQIRVLHEIRSQLTIIANRLQAGTISAADASLQSQELIDAAVQ